MPRNIVPSAKQAYTVKKKAGPSIRPVFSVAFACAPREDPGVLV